jgi:hypothetical protein
MVSQNLVSEKRMVSQNEIEIEIEISNMVSNHVGDFAALLVKFY